MALLEQEGVYELHIVTTKTGFCWPKLFRLLRAKTGTALPEPMPRCPNCRRLYQGSCACQRTAASQGYSTAPESLTGRRKRLRTEPPADVLPMRKAKGSR